MVIIIIIIIVVAIVITVNNNKKVIAIQGKETLKKATLNMVLIARYVCVNCPIQHRLINNSFLKWGTSVEPVRDTGIETQFNYVI